MFQRAPDLSRNGPGPGRGRSTRTRRRPPGQRGEFSPPGRPIQDHLQLITLPSSAHAAAPSDGAESMIEASMSANGRLAGRLPIRADPETIHRSVVQNSARRFTNSIKEPLRLADRLRDSPSPASAETAATAPGSAARTHPPATPLQPGGTSAAQSWPPPPSPCSANSRPHGAAVDTCDRQWPGRCLRDGRTAGFHRSARFLPTVVLADSMDSGRVNELSTDGC
jgi:hypothetical protein